MWNMIEKDNGDHLYSKKVSGLSNTTFKSGFWQFDRRKNIQSMNKNCTKHHV